MGFCPFLRQVGFFFRERAESWNFKIKKIPQVFKSSLVHWNSWLSKMEMDQRADSTQGTTSLYREWWNKFSPLNIQPTSDMNA